MKPYIALSAGKPDWVSWWFGAQLCIIWRHDWRNVDLSIRLGPFDLLLGVTFRDLHPWEEDL